MKLKKILCLLLAIMVLPVSFMLCACTNDKFADAVEMQKYQFRDSGNNIYYLYRTNGLSFNKGEKLVLKVVNDTNMKMEGLSVIKNVEYYQNPDGSWKGDYNGTLVTALWDRDMNYVTKDGYSEEYYTAQEVFDDELENHSYNFDCWVQVYDNNQNLIVDCDGWGGEMYDADSNQIFIKPGETFYYVVHFTKDCAIDFIVRSVNE